jgi:alpha-mannosidase
VPPELKVTSNGPLGYDLASGDHAAWDLTVQASGAEPGRYFVAARIAEASGQLIEDAVMVAVGEKRWPARDLPPEEALERMFANHQATAGEVELSVLTPFVDLTPGSSGKLAIRVTSHLASQLRGEAQLISPFGTWELLPDRAEPVILAPSASTELRFRVTMPGPARPGSTWWALVKFMYFGRVCYSDAVTVCVVPLPTAELRQRDVQAR